jgi:hypothetical protein
MTDTATHPFLAEAARAASMTSAFTPVVERPIGNVRALARRSAT